MPKSVESKVPYISDLISEKHMLFIMLTETWLLEHLDAEIHIEGYQLFRADRKREKKKKGRYSGGAALYINNKISSSREVLLRFSNSVVEVLCVHLKCHNIVMCVMNRQPSDIKGGYPSTAKEKSKTRYLEKRSTHKCSTT